MSAQPWTAQEWIDRLNSLGVWVGMRSGRLALKPADKIPSEWIPALKAAKPDLIAFLTQAGSGSSASLSASEVSLEASGPAEALAYPNSPAEAETPTEADTRPAACPTEAAALACRFDPEVRAILEDFASGMGEDLLAVSSVACSWSDCQFPATVLIRAWETKDGNRTSYLTWGCPKCGRTYQPKIISANAMDRVLEAQSSCPKKALIFDQNPAPANEEAHFEAEGPIQ